MNIQQLCDQLRATVSLRRELAEMVRDLVKRDGMSEVELLRHIEAEGVTELEELRQRLKKLRYPNLAVAEEKFAAAKKKLRLPEAIHLHPSPFFEKKELKLEMKFHSPEEFRKLVDKLNEVADNGVGDLFL